MSIQSQGAGDHNENIRQIVLCPHIGPAKGASNDNFNLHTPTRILFGKGAIAGLREQIPHDARVLITYGGGSVKKPAFSIKFCMP